MVTALRAGLLLFALAACKAPGPGLPPESVGGLPWGTAPDDRVAWSARQMVERGELAAARAEVAAVLVKAPRHVDARRLRQDILRQRGRRGLLLSEARAEVAARPRDGHAHYLLARITEDRDQKLAGFRRAAALAPGSVWPWLGLAHTLRSSDLSRAVEIYERLFDASGRHPLVGVAYAAALREADRQVAAGQVYRSIRGDARIPGVGDLGIAQVAMQREEFDVAWAALLEALRMRPYDPGVRGLVAAWLETGVSRDQRRQVVDILREEPGRMSAFGRGEGAGVLAELLVGEGHLVAARAVLERRLADGASSMLQRAYRQVLLGLGDVRAFVAFLGEAIPRDVIDVEDNELRGRWLTLLEGPWTVGDPWPSGDQALALVDALLAVGMLREVELMCDAAALRFPARAADIQRRQDEARRELAFESGLRRLLYRGYRDGDAASLREVVERLRALSERVLGFDCVGVPKTFSAPLVGEMLDPFAGSGLCEHLARYNRHLVLGRRAGGTCEGLLVTRLSVRELPREELQQLPGRCFEVIGADRDVRALGGVLGADLAGVALLNHYLVDYDAIVDWALGLVERRRVASADDVALAADAVPDGVGLDPLDAAWRLTLQSSVTDEAMAAAVLGTIRDHERRHLVDSFHYMPIEQNLARGAGLLFRFGVSPLMIEAEMERRAELAALALSPHTELVLAHIVDFYGSPPRRSPHHIGFTRLLQQLRDELVAAGVPPALAAPCKWHELQMSDVRGAAMRLLRRLPGVE